VRQAAAFVVVATLVAATSAAGQTRTPPGPWVLDVRALTSAVPTDATFYPTTLTSTLVPSRGFGGDFGGHFYVLTLGPARVGLGASVALVRATVTSPSNDLDTTATAQHITLTMPVLAPQVSFNFGSRDGWSYLSAGLGLVSVNTDTSGASPGTQDSGARRALNFGGGARWFFKPRMAFSIDVRAHRMAGGDLTPGITVVAVGAGLSIR
jgi:hypothetical protein